jgi:hypothetical protein
LLSWQRRRHFGTGQNRVRHGPEAPAGLGIHSGMQT